ncbi:MAG: ABC transporter ATP-binding protein, partial [Clostridia bacterium]|nr:ABC transporter ATP-binding protein [Clostridia bacterium]
MKNKTLQRIRGMIKPYRKTVVFVTILALLIDILALVKPYIIKILIDNFLKNGIQQQEWLSVSIIAYLYIGLVVLENFLDYFNGTRTGILGESVVYDLRNRVYTYMEKAKIKFHDKTPSGTLFVRIISDIEDVYALFSDVVTTIVKDVFIIVGLLGVMIYISYKLAAVSLIIIPLIIISSLIITKLLNKTYAAVKVVRTKMNIFFSESIYGLKVIKIFNRQKEKQKECEDITNEFRNTMKPMGLLQGLLPAIMVLIENLGIAIVIWAVVNKLVGENLEVGVIYMFITYLRNLFDPINRIIENVEIVEEAVTSIDKVYEILDKEELQEDFDSGKRIDKIKGKIEFKNVWFAYEDEKWILKDVSFTIEPGQSVALVGKTGSGKTTITNLINKFYTIQKGEILIDGININDINLGDLRRNIGTILQDPFIYAKSIKDNIKLFNDISDENIEEAVRLASANEFIENQENGIDEIARERGNSFSAGEKQLLAFARIFALNPSVFILDEATANIDTTTEQLIQESVDKLSKEKTSIFIAHRLATIVNVDKIIVLSNGKIVEEGNHNELVASGGYYSKLYNS